MAKIASPEKIEYWRRIIEDHQSSGLSVAAFCSQRQVVAHSFYWWRRRLNGPAAVSSRHGSDTAVFVPVHVAAGSANGREPFGLSIEILLRDGDRVRLFDGVDVATLRAAITALREERAC